VPCTSFLFLPSYPARLFDSTDCTLSTVLAPLSKEEIESVRDRFPDDAFALLQVSLVKSNPIRAVARLSSNDLLGRNQGAEGDALRYVERLQEGKAYAEGQHGNRYDAFRDQTW
jgi:hypothetical protein